MPSADFHGDFVRVTVGYVGAVLFFLLMSPAITGSPYVLQYKVKVGLYTNERIITIVFLFFKLS